MNERNLLSAKNPRNSSINFLPKEKDKDKIYLGDEDILFNSTKNLKQDILIFKDEILKEIKIFKNNFNERAKNNEKFVSENIENFSVQVEGFNNRIIELSNLIVTDKAIREKVDQLIEFKEKSQETIMTDGIRIDNLEKDFYNNIYRIDNILKDTVLNSKIIGGIAKFNTFYDFMKIVLDDISQLNTFKDKTISDLNNYRARLDNNINNMKKKVENSEKDTKLYTDKFIKKTEIKMNDLFEEYNSRLNDLKVQNLTYVENMRKLSDDLLTQMNNVILIKNELFNKFEEYKKDNLKVLKNFSGYKEEYYNLKKKYLEIANILKYKGDFKNFNFEIKTPLRSAFSKNRKKTIKPYKRTDNNNILRINKIEFENLEEKNSEFNSFKPDKKTLFKSTVDFNNRRSNKFGSFHSQNKVNLPLNILFDNKPNKNNIITKSVIKPFKILNESRDSKDNNNHSIIQEEEDNKEEIYSKKNISIHTNNNIEDNTNINTININQPQINEKVIETINNNEENSEIKNQKTFNKNINDIFKNNNQIQIKTIINNKNKKDELNNNYKANTIKTEKTINNTPSNLVKKVTISIEGANGIDVYRDLKKNDVLEREMFHNINNMINKEQIRNKSFNGYPKIVTNNGERIIISTRPIYNAKKFVPYTSPNILALNKCVQKLYGNKRKQKFKENDYDFFFENTTNKLNFEKNKDYDLDNLKKNLYEENSARQNATLQQK